MPQMKNVVDAVLKSEIKGKVKTVIGGAPVPRSMPTRLKPTALLLTRHLLLTR